MNYINSKDELYDKCENMEQLYDKFYYQLLVENQELEEENKILDEKLGKYIEQKQEWIELIDMFKNQQKEFIDWLKSYLKLFDNKDIYEEGYYDCIEEILSKYKEIIGSDK